MAWKNVQYENGKYRTSEGGGGGGSSTFADLEDVSFSNLQDGQVPKYNSATQKWENANESGGGGTVTDVKVDGQSVVDPQTGEADITMPTPPTIPVEDVEVNGESVVNAQKIAEIKSYKEVTQSEYNALPDSKLNDGILYAIKDVGGSDGFPPLIYSDEEREVGVWRDGKPLYQRTFRGTTSSSDNAVSVYSNAEWDVVNCEGNIEESADKIQIGAYLNSSYYCGWYFDKYDNNTLKIFYSNQYRGKDYAITIYYTKTTDTAGSGTWTTQGALAHHYNTDEHIIGTWIDGKPLYEKVFALSQRATCPSQQWFSLTEIPITTYNLKIIANAKVIDISSASGEKGTLTNIFMTDCTDTYLRIWSTRSSNIGFTHVVLQYTKTTD